MQTTLTVTPRNVYGNTMYYPACDQSRRLAELSGKKTLSVDAMCIAHGMGFVFTFLAETPELPAALLGR